MFCPICKSEYRIGYTFCKDCNVELVSELPVEPEPSWVDMIKLFSPRHSEELSLIKSILDSEGITYFVHNDYFGSLIIGPNIDLYNRKMILVQKDQYDRAKELLIDYLEETEEKDIPVNKSYSLFDKIRMFVEIVLFGWIMPGKRKNRKQLND